MIRKGHRGSSINNRDSKDRMLLSEFCPASQARLHRMHAQRTELNSVGGPEGIRTPGLVSAIHALSQLSYGPTAVAPSADLRV